jgi:hypothetical protein
VKPPILFVCLAMLVICASLAAEPAIEDSGLADSGPLPSAGSGVTLSPASRPATAYHPFSRVAIGGGVSPLGIQMQVATNLNRYMNLRGTGNIFNYSANNISSNGFNIDAKASLASTGTSLDIYPFPNHGLRVSPGVLFHNTNSADGVFTAQGGTSFALNGYTYYASSTSPVHGSGSVGLHSQNPAFTITTGWGNMIPHKGGHFSFPVELGVAFVGAPTVNVALTSGQVCDAQGQNCLDVATDPDVQSNLQAQVAKYKKDLEPLQTYPIVSFGVAYSFSIRRAGY